MTDGLIAAGTAWSDLRVCVVGAGYMGAGIAQILAAAGGRVRVVDQDPELAVEAVRRLTTAAVAFEARGLMPAGTAARVALNSSPARSVADGVSDADLVVEAVFEDVAVKHAVLEEIAASAPKGAVVASNTSAIPIAVLAEALESRARLVGMHWFNPPQFVPGVELIPGPDTDRAVIEWLRDLLRLAGKWPVIVRDAPGFVANRLQFALFREATLMVEEGIASAAEIDEVVKGSFGFRLPFYGPFAIADMAGLDVYAGAFDTLHEKLGDRFAPPAILSDLVAAGRLGVKDGGGFLDLSADEAQAMIDRRDASYVALLHLAESTAQLTASVTPEHGRG
jgi:3-hydroxybutyryl-CoA dehydrogenase